MVGNAALVTGAASPLGAAMALALADLGFEVAVQDVACTIDLAEQIRAKGRSAVALQSDLRDREQLDALVSLAADGLGSPLTCLINNAASPMPDELASITHAGWRQQIDAQLWVPVRLAQLFAQQAPKGRRAENGEPFAQNLVVNIIDQRVSACAPDFMTHSIVAAGMQAFTQTAALDVSPDIRVNAIGLGPQRPGQYQFAGHASDHRFPEDHLANFCQVAASLRYFLQAPAVTGQLVHVHVEQSLNSDAQSSLKADNLLKDAL